MEVIKPVAGGGAGQLNRLAVRHDSLRQISSFQYGFKASVVADRIEGGVRLEEIEVTPILFDPIKCQVVFSKGRIDSRDMVEHP